MGDSDEDRDSAIVESASAEEGRLVVSGGAAAAAAAAAASGVIRLCRAFSAIILLLEVFFNLFVFCKKTKFRAKKLLTVMDCPFNMSFDT